jgi:hypothetical protein
VDRASSSAAPADAIAAEIRGAIAAQRERVQKRDAEMSARVEEHRIADDEFFRSQELHPAAPPGTPAPECDEKNMKHKD